MAANGRNGSLKAAEGGGSSSDIPPDICLDAKGNSRPCWLKYEDPPGYGYPYGNSYGGAQAQRSSPPQCGPAPGAPGACGTASAGAPQAGYGHPAAYPGHGSVRRREPGSAQPPMKAPRRGRSPSFGVETASSSPARTDSSRCSPRGDRAGLLCANPGCSFLIHPEPDFGGFCCKKCHWCFVTGSKTKKKHGQQCKRVEAPGGDGPRAGPHSPTNPLAPGDG